MRRIILLFAAFLLGILGSLQAGEKLEGRVAKMLQNIHWLGHASFRIDASKTIYIDPYKLGPHESAKTADFVLITHSHFDHFSEPDIKKIAGPNTVFFVTKDLAGKVEGKVYVMTPGKKEHVDGITVEAVPAYNIGKKFHPRANQWVGYVITIDSVRIYHAGDTDFVPEMKELKDIDFALVPVGGTYTMDAKEAAEAVNTFRPKVAIPMHWGAIVGKESDAEAFKRMAKVHVEILHPEE